MLLKLLWLVKLFCICCVDVDASSIPCARDHLRLVVGSFKNSTELGILNRPCKNLYFTQTRSLLHRQCVHLLSKFNGLCFVSFFHKLRWNWHFNKPRYIECDVYGIVDRLEFGEFVCERRHSLDRHWYVMLHVLGHFNSSILRNWFFDILRNRDFSEYDLFLYLRHLNDLLHRNLSVLVLRHFYYSLLCHYFGNFNNALFDFDTWHFSHFLLHNFLHDLNNFLDVFDFRHLDDLLLNDRFGDFNDLLNDVHRVLNDVLSNHFLRNHNHLLNHVLTDDSFGNFHFVFNDTFGQHISPSMCKNFMLNNMLTNNTFTHTHGDLSHAGGMCGC
mmetsp:Transcript_452/g.420  ORF Transcript_452/g.420 Transcript_452/m.420 type:complete len:329 (-) Transcript_452:150-1136(-)